LAGVDCRDTAVVTSFRNFTRNFGGTIGLAVAGTILNNLLSSRIPSLNPSNDGRQELLRSPEDYLATISAAQASKNRQEITPAYRDGFRIIFIMGASLAGLAFCLCFVLMPQVQLDRPDDEKLKEAGKRWQEERRK
jgi:hypothetical protein